MGSPITFSGFNNIDFNVVLNSIMQQESQPLQALQVRQSALQSQITNLGTLGSRVSALQNAADKLSQAETMAGFTATSSDNTAVGVSVGATATAGHYDIVVKELARAQVTASASIAPDADTTIVATGGSLTINGHAIAVSQPATLRQLADAINADADASATAAVVQSGAASFRLVLTAKSTGAANAFTVTNGLTGGSGVTFTDTDLDGTSGDTAADNAVQALNASVSVNNIEVSSASNTLESVVPGATIRLLRKDPSATIAVDVATDPTALKTRVTNFITAYNDLVKFTKDQSAAASKGDAASIGRDPMVRQLRNTLRAAVSSSYATGGSTNYLSQVGVEFTEAGTLQLDEAAFEKIAKSGASAVAGLFAGTTGQPGVFASVGTMLREYTQTSGILQKAQKQLGSQVSHLGEQVIDMQARLAVKRAALQKEFIAADQAMTQLKNQSGSLASFGANI